MNGHNEERFGRLRSNSAFSEVNPDGLYQGYENEMISNKKDNEILQVPEISH